MRLLLEEEKIGFWRKDLKDLEEKSRSANFLTS